MRRTPTQAKNDADDLRKEIMDEAENDPDLREYFRAEEKENEKLYTKRGPPPARRGTKKNRKLTFSDAAMEKPPGILKQGFWRPGQWSTPPPTPTQAPPQPSALEDDLFGETNILGEVVTNKWKWRSRKKII